MKSSPTDGIINLLVCGRGHGQGHRFVDGDTVVVCRSSSVVLKCSHTVVQVHTVSLINAAPHTRLK